MFIDVLFGFIWNWLKPIVCKIIGHKWSMYAGYEQIRVHPSAVCERCKAKYNG